MARHGQSKHGIITELQGGHKAWTRTAPLTGGAQPTETLADSAAARTSIGRVRETHRANSGAKRNVSGVNWPQSPSSAPAAATPAVPVSFDFALLHDSEPSFPNAAALGYEEVWNPSLTPMGPSREQTQPSEPLSSLREANGGGGAEHACDENGAAAHSAENGAAVSGGPEKRNSEIKADLRRQLLSRYRVQEEPAAGVGGEGGRSSLDPVTAKESSRARRLAAAHGLGISQREYKVRLAMAKMIGGFMIREGGQVGLEKSSVYGAAILMPQVARSGGWPRFLTSLVVRAYIFLFINVVLQGGLLYMIQKEESVMDLFGGQMYLCDFGARQNTATADSTLQEYMGPLGTPITAQRLHPFPAWSVRLFVRDSLKTLFPDRHDDIERLVDPGEYGLESYSCRLLCCFIFMMSVMSELYLNIRMLQLIYYVPTKNEYWLRLQEDGGDCENWLESVGVAVAGMSMFWKVVNILVVLLPKIVLWKITADAGVTFLMETSRIEDLIVNSVALTFVLNIDEMMFELMSDATKMCLSSSSDLLLYDYEVEESLPEEEIMEIYGRQQELRHSGLWDLASFFPKKLFVACALTIWFVMEYYFSHCQYIGSWTWFSKDMYLPQGVTLTWATALLPSVFDVPRESEPFWQMPSK
eukprot:TRINITY_DN10697_c0_g1_i1.p1 TRINITY_DN10697_c0_g1~~TRINITY_DN10697_c0_g1_i1.p1  ORF type:complete len:642 (-),score=142.35 TRINITY_DN10697_c0_g1_i1:62-1987(-)